MQDLKKELKKYSSNIYQEIKDIRIHLHENPELSFKEFETSAFIKSFLDKNQISYIDKVAKTGIVARLESGTKPSKKTIALRADMDALPIEEDKNNKYCSHNTGVMHACGHDLHIASLLGVAKTLNKFSSYWEGTIYLIFQPGEELLPGGAKLILEQDVMKPKPELILAQHVLPDMKIGEFGFKSGIYMASGDEIYLEIKSKGGHGAMPHKTTDTVLAASHIIVALQQIVSRRCDARIPTVLSFGKFIANGATNIIPEKVNIEGTFRTFNEQWRNEAKELIKEIATCTAKSMGCECEVEIKHGYPCLYNNETISNLSQELAKDYCGEENIKTMDIRLTTEDFGYFSQEYPVCFYRFGVNSENALHSSKFEAQDESLIDSVGLMSWLSINLMNS
ncbi:MAG: M20 family metallopeptidase [Marinifilaceae bacterium]|jgi:amidohydrolase|nr:M20 family metallopeptidase [Marinifilaceae bacterium]